MTYQKKFEDLLFQVSQRNTNLVHTNLGHKQIADPVAKIDPSETKFDSISKTPTTEKPNLVEKFDMNMVFPTFDDYQSNQNQEYEVDMPNLKNQKDGVQTYQPHEGEPLQTGM